MSADAQKRWMRKTVAKLERNARREGYMVAAHTNMDGNCFYESMVNRGYGKNISSLRLALGYLFFQYGDFKGFFPNQPEMTLRDLFQFTNEIEWIKDEQTLQVKRYTYDTMCADLRTSGSWTRMPMQIIMMTLSLLYDLQFRIFTDSGADSYTVAWNEDIKHYKNVVALGKMDEFHYVPMKEIPPDDSDSDEDDIDYEAFIAARRRQLDARRAIAPVRDEHHTSSAIEETDEDDDEFDVDELMRQFNDDDDDDKSDAVPKSLQGEGLVPPLDLTRRQMPFSLDELDVEDAMVEQGENDDFRTWNQSSDEEEEGGDINWKGGDPRDHAGGDQDDFQTYDGQEDDVVTVIDI
jgi:hypothetical protein